MRKQLSFLKRRFCIWAFAFCSCVLPFAVQADVWGYIDAKGVAHFAAQKLDGRYELFFKGASSLDAPEGVVNPNGNTSEATSESAQYARPVTVPKGKSKLLAFFEVSPNFKAVRHHMREAAKLHNIDFELLQAMIATESGFDANAVSPKGAVGLMQLMPPTAQRYGVKGDDKTTLEKKLTDPQINIGAGSRYLADLLRMFPGKIELALAAYNAGEGAVQKHGNAIPPYKETQNYVATVLQIYQHLKPPKLVSKPIKEPVETAQTAPKTIVNPTPGMIAGRGNMLPPLTQNPAAMTLPPPFSKP